MLKMIYTRDLCGMYKETYIYEMRPTKETYVVEREIYITNIHDMRPTKDDLHQRSM